MKFADELQWIYLKKGHQDSCYSNSHQGDMLFIVNHKLLPRDPHPWKQSVGKIFFFCQPIMTLSEIACPIWWQDDYKVALKSRTWYIHRDNSNTFYQLYNATKCGHFVHLTWHRKHYHIDGVGHTWWRHQMETFSALLAICVGNSLVSGGFPTQRPVRRSFDVFFDLCLNKRLSNQSWGWWFETPSHPLWRHCNVYKP